MTFASRVQRGKNRILPRSHTVHRPKCARRRLKIIIGRTACSSQPHSSTFSLPTAAVLYVMTLHTAADAVYHPKNPPCVTVGALYPCHLSGLATHLVRQAFVIHRVTAFIAAGESACGDFVQSMWSKFRGWRSLLIEIQTRHNYTWTHTMTDLDSGFRNTDVFAHNTSFDAASPPLPSAKTHPSQLWAQDHRQQQQHWQIIRHMKAFVNTIDAIFTADLYFPDEVLSAVREHLELARSLQISNELRRCMRNFSSTQFASMLRIQGAKTLIEAEIGQIARHRAVVRLGELC